MGRGLKLDPDDNVYLAGRFGSSIDVEPGPAILNLQATGTSDIFVLKLDADGSYLWAKGFGGSGGENIAGLALDADRNVYLAGNFFGTVDFNPTPGAANVFPLSSNGSFDAFVLTLNTSGDFVRAVNFGGVGEEVVRGIAVDASGSAHTTGYFTGTADFNPASGDDNFYPLVSAGSFDSFISKLNPDGSFAWAVRQGNSGPDQDSNTIRIDQDGNVYTAGGFQSQVVFDPSVPGGTLTSAGDFDVYLSKRDGAGNFLWARRMGGTGQDIAYGLEVDLSGDVYTTGQFTQSASFGDATNPVTLTSAGSTDIFVSKRDANGNYISAYQMGGTQLDRGRSIAVDPAFGRIYTTGQFTGSADFDPGAGQFLLVGQGTSDIFLSQLRQNSRPRNVDLGPDIDTFEGTTISVTGSFEDPDVTDSWTATVDYGDGSGQHPLALLPDKSFNLSFAYPDDGSYIVTVVVTDGGGLSSTGTLTVQVSNVVPQNVAIAGPASGTRGQPLSFVGSFTDPGAATHIRCSGVLAMERRSPSTPAPIRRLLLPCTLIRQAAFSRSH